MEKILNYEDLTEAERDFLRRTNDLERRPALLACLEQVGLLEDFLQIENETV